MEKSSIRKAVNILFGHVGVVELTYRNIFLFKFTFILILFPLFDTSDINTGGKLPPVSMTLPVPLTNLLPVSLNTGGAPLTCDQLREFLNKFE
jgi:hypothetical protein